jgi:hypothetical protein
VGDSINKAQREELSTDKQDTLLHTLFHDDLRPQCLKRGLQLLRFLLRNVLLQDLWHTLCKLLRFHEVHVWYYRLDLANHFGLCGCVEGFKAESEDGFSFGFYAREKEPVRWLITHIYVVSGRACVPLRLVPLPLLVLVLPLLPEQQMLA